MRKGCQGLGLTDTLDRREPVSEAGGQFVDLAVSSIRPFSLLSQEPALMRKTKERKGCSKELGSESASLQLPSEVRMEKINPARNHRKTFSVSGPHRHYEGSAAGCYVSILTKPWNLSALARIAGASERHLSRLFHEHVGMSIPEYSNRLRVAYAQELLRETRFDMERVAEQSGFSSTRQLRRAWERIHKTPPREARLHSQAQVASTRSNHEA
jgi:AraC-like DNA-binding protein